MRALLVALALAGCGVRSAEPSPSPEAVFPHPDGYPGHGVDWRRASASCLTCHAPLGEAVTAGPACTSCHPAYPHLPEIRPGAAHGAAWAADPSLCVDCHGADGTRVVAEVLGSACTGCHATYPHDVGFAEAHGAPVRARGGADACLACHADGPTACASCHDAYPHPDGWAAPDHHGRSSAPCEGCHGPPAPPGTPACAGCHDTFPHPDGWVAFGHLPVVQARGDAGCLGCHPSMTGPRIPHRCSTACHGTSP